MAIVSRRRGRRRSRSCGAAQLPAKGPPTSSRATTGARSAGKRQRARSTRSRTVSSPLASARRRGRHPRPDEPRVGAVRLRAGIDRRDRRRIYPSLPPRDCAYILDHRTRLPSWSRTTSSAPRSTPSGQPPKLRHVFSFDDLDDLRAKGRSSPPRTPTRWSWPVPEVGEEDLFTYIYTSGRPAQGLHDLAPQLLLDGRRRR